MGSHPGGTAGLLINNLRSRPQADMISTPRGESNAICPMIGAGGPATVTAAVPETTPFTRVAVIPVVPPLCAVTKPAASTMATQAAPLRQANAAPATG